MKYYSHCPDCRTRMKRTGKNQREAPTREGRWIYAREYECPKCGSIWVYSEYYNSFRRGNLQTT